MDNRNYSALEKVHNESVKRDKDLADHLNRVIRQQALSGQISALEQQKHLLAHFYQTAGNFTNLVILAGYAGLFGIWQFVRGYLDQETTILTATLATTSIILFAGFEVYKMISQAFFFRRLNRVILRDIPEQDRIKAWQHASVEWAQVQYRIWLYFLIPIVLTGFGAGIILLFTFLRLLPGTIAVPN